MLTSTVTLPDTPTTSVSTVPAPFLNGFAAIHDAMRRDAERLPRAVAAVQLADQAMALAGWFGRYRVAIEHHHHREDEVVWPDLTARDPGFAEALDQLEADHHELDRAMDHVDAELARLAAGDLSHRAAAVEAVDEFATVLHDHLEREESAAFERIAAAYTEEEYADLEERLNEDATLTELAFVAPWIADELDAQVLADLLQRLPIPLRLALRFVFTPRYRRLAAPVLAVAR